jgi:hypothetical protein
MVAITRLRRRRVSDRMTDSGFTTTLSSRRGPTRPHWGTRDALIVTG